MNMTKEQLTEYLERTRSMLDADLDTIVEQTTEQINLLERKDRAYVFNTLNEVTEIGNELLSSIDELIVKLCK